MKTPRDFYLLYNGRVIDDDGAYGSQCVDGWRVFCKWIGLAPKPTPNNWADGYWYYRDQLGYSADFYYVYDYHDFRDGDWVIWAKGSASHPSSHIAMYYQGMEFGENQGGNGGFSLKGTVFTDALGALRWKGFGMELAKGYSVHSFKGINVNVIRASADKGFSLHLLSAGGLTALKDIMQFDSDKLAIVGCVNANYFEMGNGMHLGCEGDGWVKGYSQEPKTAGIISYYIAKDGSVGAHDQSEYWLSQDQVQMVCAPYAVKYHQGKAVDMRSSSFGSKELVKNTQTIAFKLDGDWCLAIFSECFPSDAVAFVEQFGTPEEMIVMDSGGSTQMFECATTGKRKSVRHTSRLLPNVLVLAQEINGNTADPGKDDDTPIEEPNQPSDEPEQPSEPSTEPSEPNEEPNEGNEESDPKGIWGMSNKTYDVLKFIAQIVLPALATLIVSLGNLWGMTNTEQIAGTIIAIDAFLGALLQISTNVYNKNKGVE